MFSYLQPQPFTVLSTLRKGKLLWQKFWNHPLAQRLLLLRVGLLLISVRLSLALMPFGMLYAVLTKLGDRHVKVDQVDDLPIIVQVTRSLGRLLLGDSPCLTEALTVQTFFRRRGYPAELRIGVSKSRTGQLCAHAWVESAGTIVIG